MYKLAFFVPESHLEPVKQAVFAAGAGRLGNYEHCCWQTLGQGQFRALKNAEPFLGECGKRELVAEYRVELVCEDNLVRQAVAALKAAHPYETSAFDLWRLESVE